MRTFLFIAALALAFGSGNGAWARAPRLLAVEFAPEVTQAEAERLLLPAGLRIVHGVDALPGVYATAELDDNGDGDGGDNGRRRAEKRARVERELQLLEQRDLVVGRQWQEYTSRRVPQILPSASETQTFGHTSGRDAPLAFSDPLYPQQWYLNDASRSINVQGAWARGLNGSGVSVAVIDDGLNATHPDLRGAFWADGSADFSERSLLAGGGGTSDDGSSVLPRDEQDWHGTACAGVIAAAANNGICGVGVAPGVRLAALRLQMNETTDVAEAAAFSHRSAETSVYSVSWGPADTGGELGGPGPLTNRTLAAATALGRRGRGAVYVFASGNGGGDDGCNFDGYANSQYGITVAAVNADGARPNYGEPCAASVVAAYSSFHSDSPSWAVATTDISAHGNAQGGQCTTAFGGTSAAAPLVAGVLALVLQQRPELTWRDLRAIAVASAAKVGRPDGYAANAAGYTHSYDFGFGAIDAERALRTAEGWSLLAHPQLQRVLPPQASGLGVRAAETLVERVVVTTQSRASGAVHLESVLVKVDLLHPARGALRVTLTSPGGTASELAAPRARDDSGDGLVGWTFSTVRCWGEDPSGTWTLAVEDTRGAGAPGLLRSWQLSFTGTCAREHWLPRNASSAVRNPYCEGGEQLAVDEDAKLSAQTLVLLAAAALVAGLAALLLVCSRKQSAETVSNEYKPVAGAPEPEPEPAVERPGERPGDFMLSPTRSPILGRDVDAVPPPWQRWRRAWTQWRASPWRFSRLPDDESHARAKMDPRAIPLQLLQPGKTVQLRRLEVIKKGGRGTGKEPRSPLTPGADTRQDRPLSRSTSLSGAELRAGPSIAAGGGAAAEQLQGPPLKRSSSRLALAEI